MLVLDDDVHSWEIELIPQVDEIGGEEAVVARAHDIPVKSRMRREMVWWR